MVPSLAFKIFYSLFDSKLNFRSFFDRRSFRQLSDVNQNDKQISSKHDETFCIYTRDRNEPILHKKLLLKLLLSILNV